MIYTLSIECAPGAYLQDPFERIVEAPDDMTLGELHETIQDLTDFDNDHLFTLSSSAAVPGENELNSWKQTSGRNDMTDYTLSHLTECSHSHRI